MGLMRRLPAAVEAALDEAERQQRAHEAERQQRAHEAEPAASPPSSLDERLAYYPLTDLGNAERFRDRWSGKLISVPAIGWHWWDGRRWARDGADEKLAQAIYATVRAIQDEARAIRGTAADKVIETKKNGKAVTFADRLSGWGRASEQAAKISAIGRLGASFLTVDAAQLDADPWKINVLNGTLVIRRAAGDEDHVSFKPHDQADCITKIAPVVYDPGATCPLYDRFMVEVQPKPEQRRFLHQWGGYSLTGDVGEQKLTFFYGKGRNGKSTLVDAWGAVAGDYGEIIPIETFVDQGRGRNAGAATPDLAILPGVRLLRTSEPEKGAKLAEALIKLVTGGEPIQARHLNRDYFKFRPAFKLTMSGNYRPKIDGTDEGIWRRVVLVPWTVTVAAPDLELPARLREEGSGILNRLLDGLRDYLDHGLVVPEDVAAATLDYREDSDPLGRFLADAVVVEIGSRVASRRMHDVFVAWAKSAGEREWSPKGLTMALKERGFQLRRSDGSQWLDLRLVKSEFDFADASDRSPHPETELPE